MENLSANICRYLSASRLPPSRSTLKVSLESRLRTELRLKGQVMCKPTVSQPGQSHVLPMWPPVLLLAKISEYLCICAQPLLQSTPAVIKKSETGQGKAAISLSLETGVQSPQNCMSAIWIRPFANVYLGQGIGRSRKRGGWKGKRFCNSMYNSKEVSIASLAKECVFSLKFAQKVITMCKAWNHLRFWPL